MQTFVKDGSIVAKQNVGRRMQVENIRDGPGHQHWFLSANFVRQLSKAHFIKWKGLCEEEEAISSQPFNLKQQE